MQKLRSIKAPFGRIYTGTYLGRAAQSIATSEGNGHRLVIRRWIDTGETELRDITGDGRRADFVEHRKIDLGVTTSIDHAITLAEDHR